MKVALWITTTLGFGILVGHLITSADAQFRTAKTTRLLTTDLADWCNGKEVTIELIEAGPGTSGKHYHSGHSFTYVLDGSEAYALNGKASKTVHAGDILHEAPRQVHVSDNVSPVKLLVIRVIEKGEPASVRLP